MKNVYKQNFAVFQEYLFGKNDVTWSSNTANLLMLWLHNTLYNLNSIYQRVKVRNTLIVNSQTK